MTRSRPLPNTYWLPDGLLLAGEYPGSDDPDEAAERLAARYRAGVDTFIDLTEPHELTPYQEALGVLASEHRPAPSYHRLPVRDLDVPTPEQMERILDLIDREQAAGRRVYVHCWGGVGRTGTVVGCHLVRRGATGRAALDRIAELWQGMEKRHRAPRSPETSAQRAFVLDWEAREGRRRPAAD
jgi:hypothetical protein